MLLSCRQLPGQGANEGWESYPSSLWTIFLPISEWWIRCRCLWSHHRQFQTLNLTVDFFPHFVQGRCLSAVIDFVELSLDDVVCFCFIRCNPCAWLISLFWDKKAGIANILVQWMFVENCAGFRETLRADIDVGRFQRPESRSKNMNLVIVSHGLTLRVFLMRWYKWTVEQFEGLYNFGYTEMLVMELGPGGR